VNGVELPPRFWARQAPQRIATNVRLVDEVVYRYIWELTYRTGYIVRQYTVHGPHVFKVRLAGLPMDGIGMIEVWDAERPRVLGPVTSITVPHGARVAIKDGLTIRINQGLRWTIERVYKYGWVLGPRRHQVCINPSMCPPRIWEVDTYREDRTGRWPYPRTTTES